MAKEPWFVEWGWIYRPVSWQGWLVTALTVLFCVHIFLFVDAHSHSVSDTLYGVFPYVVPVLLALGWIASKTSQKN